jgi:Flp pilus assembly pilin Flp
MNSISYCLIAVLIALAIVAGVNRIGESLSTTFCTIGAHLQDGPTLTTCTTKGISQ